MDNIKAFLADIGAVVPENFVTEIDDALMALASSMTVELVQPPQNQLNVEYTKNNASERVSYPGDDALCTLQAEAPAFPITKKGLV